MWSPGKGVSGRKSLQGLVAMSWRRCGKGVKAGKDSFSMTRYSQCQVVSSDLLAKADVFTSGLGTPVFRHQG